MKGDMDVETCFNYCDKEHGYFSSDERRFITKVRKLKEKYPEQVRIIAEPEQNDGCIYAEMPTAWLRIQPPVKRVLTEEQREANRVRMQQMHRNGLIHAK